MLHISVYSTFANSIPIEQRDVEWAEVVEILQNIVIADAKDDVPLFNFVKFAQGKPRQKQFATAVTGLILDIDNTAIVKGVKQDLAAPLTPEEICVLLQDYEYVIVSTHSHLQRPNNPRVRVFMPLVEPVSATRWLEYAEQALKQLGLQGVAGIDPCFHTVTQPYYFPSARDRAPTFFQHNEGEWLKIEEPEPEDTRRIGGKDDRFSLAQVAKYWTDRCPEIDQYEPGPNFEVRMPCPLHAGTRPNFQVSLLTGQWCCFSNCTQNANNGKIFGGDIYKFEQVRYSKTFPQAKSDVNSFLGILPDDPLVPEDQLTDPEDLAAMISATTPGEIQDVLPEIVKHRPSVRDELVQQLVRQTGADPAEIAKLVAVATAQVQGGAPRSSQYDFGFDPVFQTGAFVGAVGYMVTNEGVILTKRVKTKDGDVIDLPQKALTTRAIWISALGVDYANGRMMTRLSWFGSTGRIHHEWFSSDVTNSREVLLNQQNAGLDNTPVNQQEFGSVSKYLNDVSKRVTNRQNVSSAPGWIKHENQWQYVWPAVSDIEYVGKPFPSLGTSEDWAKPLDAIISLGQDGFVAMLCLGLACASPAVRFLNDKRNPVLALCFKSSQGKGTLINYALSIFADPKSCTIPVNSTVKGAQDMLKKQADMVAFQDEVQQLKKSNPRNAEDIIYSMGNATKRITSSKSQEVIGGEFSPGVRYLAAEELISIALQTGAALRMLEMTQAPLPPNSDVLVQAIKHATASNYGTLVPKLAEYYSQNRAAIKVKIEMVAEAIKAANSGLQGEDEYTIALAYAGLEILGMLTNRTFPLDAFKAWLIDYVQRERAQLEDQPTVAFRRMLQWLWTHGAAVAGSSEIGDGRGGTIAVRGMPACDPDAPTEIMYEMEAVRQFLKDNGMTSEAALKVWADRGFIMKVGDEYTFTRKKQLLAGAKVIKIPDTVLVNFGYPADGKPEIQL